MSVLYSPVVVGVVVMRTIGVVCDDQVDIMTTFSFQLRFHIRFYVARHDIRDHRYKIASHFVLH